jgi:hypothetical protein
VRYDRNTKVGQLCEPRRLLCKIPPKSTDILRNNDVEATSARIGQHLLIPGPLRSGAPADRCVGVLRNYTESVSLCEALADAELIVD